MQAAKSVLIIASEKGIQSFLSGHLGQMGLSCHVANTAKDGFELLHNMRPDLIVISDKLVDGSGFETAKQIKFNGHKDVPMITISYLEQNSEIPKAVHLTRPVRLTKLRQLVKDFLQTGDIQWQTV